jgi:hypothetical protein
MREAGILPDFAGVVVSDRYVNYFHESWEHFAGNQACLAHYPGTAVMPVTHADGCCMRDSLVALPA